MKKLTRSDYDFNYADALKYLPISQEWKEHEKHWNYRKENLLKIPDSIQKELNLLPCDFFRKIRLRNYYRSQAKAFIENKILLDAINCAKIYAEAVRNLDESIWFSVMLYRPVYEKSLKKKVR